MAEGTVAWMEGVEQPASGAHIHFLGMRQDFPKLLSMLNPFVLPSLSEGLSLALFEAMAAGKTSGGQSCRGKSGTGRSQRTGFLVQPEDPRELAANLVKLLIDPGMIQQFGQQGAERVRQHFSMRQMIDRYSELYAMLSIHNSGKYEK